MTEAEEKKLKDHLNAIDAEQLRLAKEHADLATHEGHTSFATIQEWVGGILGVTLAPGLVWKAIKAIKKH